MDDHMSGGKSDGHSPEPPREENEASEGEQEQYHTITPYLRKSAKPTRRPITVLSPEE